MPQEYGHWANQTVGARKQVPCLICEDPHPRYSWTDYSGEGYCVRCGTPYQLQWGKLSGGDEYPRMNIRPESIPILRRYWQETGKPNGLGTFFMWDDYPDQLEARQAFNHWEESREKEKP